MVTIMSMRSIPAAVVTIMTMSIITMMGSAPVAAVTIMIMRSIPAAVVTIMTMSIITMMGSAPVAAAVIIMTTMPMRSLPPGVLRLPRSSPWNSLRSA